MSEERKQKEASMDWLAQERFDTDLERLTSSVAKGSIVRLEKVSERQEKTTRDTQIPSDKFICSDLFFERLGFQRYM